MKNELPRIRQSPPANRVHELYQTFQKKRNPLGCFDALYAESGDNITKIPWARQQPNPCLLTWDQAKKSQENGWTGRALVIGCGLGDDAEYLAAQGWKVMAFDLSLHAIQWARRRFPQSPVHYFQADLFQLPSGFYRTFDLVFESSTVQAIPVTLREKTVKAIAETVAPGGRLMAVARAREENDPLGAMPWPLSPSEINLFKKFGLKEISLADQFISHPQGPVRIFQAEYIRERR